MKPQPIVVFGCLGMAIVIPFLLLSKLQQKPESIAILIRDGSGMLGYEILNAAYFLSSESSVEISFHSEVGTSDSITAVGQTTVSNLPCDWMLLELRGDEISMNDEILGKDELKSRLLTYAESARLVDSMPFILVAARSETTGFRLVELFQTLKDSNIDFIIATYTSDTANAGPL